MAKRDRNSLIDVLRVLALRGIGMILGIASAFILAAFLGASALVDAYFFARRTIGSFQSIAEVLIETLMVPSLVAKAQRDGGQSLRGLSRRFELWSFAICTALCIALILGGGHVVDALAPGLAAESRGPAIAYFAILLITIPITVLTSIKSATLLALRHFSRPALARLLPRAMLVVALLLLPFGVDLTWAVIAFVVGNVLMMLMFLRLTDRALTQASSAPTASTPQRSLSAGHGAAIIIFALCTLIEVLMDTYFASLAGVGALAILTIGQRISNVGASELNRSLLSVYYTNFAEHAAAGDKDAFAREITTAIRSGLFFLAPLGFFLFTLAEPLVAVLLDFDAFSPQARALTAQVIAWVAIATVLRSPVAVMENAVLADFDAPHARYAVLSTVLSLAVRLALVLALLPTIGLLAVVYSAIAGTLVKLVFGVVWLRTQGGFHFARKDLGQITLVTALGIIAAMGAAAGMRLFPEQGWGAAAGLVICTVAALGPYGVLAARLGLPEASWVVGAIRRKLRR
ncbi:lipid II flippase MurJ [Tropicibacter naphthalenivorans]|uniref:Integral membrane protein MviN n=1 Tax=Tropicibacter naphthalenivorans TaxID=441103 RepID=A0A0P1GL60_9RHOB|nr:lipid II flippase MurJ [Tropicibacter naphthalenivorans]CUH74944.1 integral membrane protein MviN [Tropicibacter naphthalenivorans]SMC47892.1 Peptidoglycan biosynthesis protein MviN/MurJ, putative lipid II flippase [Tropicibacter naphthalenivorans]